jgi:FAT domain
VVHLILILLCEEAALGVLKVSTMGEAEEPETNVGTVRDGRYADASRHQHEMYYSVAWNTKDRPMIHCGPVDLSSREELWLAKLGAWTEALAVFEEKLKRDPHDFDAIVGCMRCLISNGEWRKVLELADKNSSGISGGPKTEIMHGNGESSATSQRKAIRMCAQAAWRLGQWDELERYATQLVGYSENAAAPIAGAPSREGTLPLVDFDGAFYSAVLHVHKKEWIDAANLLDAARRAMDGRLTALMAESYSRAYPSMVTAQTLAEMEEIIDFRKTEERAHASALRHPTNRHSAEEARNNLLSVWRKRLAGCRLDAEVHSSILAVRSLVLGPADEVESTLLLSELSRQGQRYKFAERVLLDPLDALQADLNGPTFGFHGSDKLQIRVDFSSMLSNSFPATIDRIVSGDLVSIVPTYGALHQQWSKSLVDGAGGIDR